jgi:hypothetical protein
MTGETADWHPGEHAGRGSPPGWYADPVRESTLRRWDGEHWAADIESWPTPRGTERSMSETGQGYLDRDDFRIIGKLTCLVFLWLILVFSVGTAFVLWGFSQEG